MLRFGPFSIEFVRVTHSIPDATNLIIRTPVGIFYHGSDFKFDWTPIDGQQTDVGKIARTASEGILCLLSDCVRVESPGYTLSEKTIEDTLEKELRGCNGKFIFTTLNGLFPLYHSVEKFCATNSIGDNATYRSNTFDLMTFRDYNITEIEGDSGNKKSLECNERYYVPSEITWLLKSLGYRKIDILGAKLGAFSRKDKLTTEDFEMLIIAEK